MTPNSRQLEILVALLGSGGYLTEELCECMDSPGAGWTTWDVELAEIERAGWATRHRRRRQKHYRWHLTVKGRALAEAARWGHVR